MTTTEIQNIAKTIHTNFDSNLSDDEKFKSLQDHYGDSDTILIWDAYKNLNSDAQVDFVDDVLTPSISDADVAIITAMSKTERRNLRVKINQIDLRKVYPLDRQRKGFVCPICQNGSGSTGDGISARQDTDKYGNDYLYHHCFKCGKFEGKLTDIIPKLNHFQSRDFFKTLAIGKKILERADTADVQQLPPLDSSKTYSDEEKKKLRRFILDAFKNIEFLPVEDRRGLSLDTLQHFHCGYVHLWQHPKVPNAPETPRLIIPNSDWTYNAILPLRLRGEVPKKYWKENAGTKFTFNFDSISTDSINIVVEGEIDAMSIYQATNGKYNVVALGGVSNGDKLIQALNNKIPADTRIDFQFLVLLDNDDAGKSAAKKLTADLINYGYPAVYNFLSTDTEKVDANDILCKQGDDELKQLIDTIISGLNFADAINRLSASQDITPRKSPLTNKLQAVNKQLAEFNAQKDSAIAKIKNLETFDSDSVFADDIVNAAAYAKLFDHKIYSDFIKDVKLFGDKNREKKAQINDLKAAIKEQFEIISARHNALNTERSQIIGAIKTKQFISDNADFSNYTLPASYALSIEDGITKIEDKGKLRQIAMRPIIISHRTKAVTDRTFKVVLDYWTAAGKHITLPPMPKSTVFNAKKIVDLADYGLPVSSADALLLTGFLNAIDALNDDIIPQVCTVPKCGWYDGDADIFVDPRRENFITDDDKSYPLQVDSASKFAASLQSNGDLSQWIKAYDFAKKSPIARFIIAAAIAPPLLKILGERNFLLYLYGKTRAGKTTTLTLAASTIGTEKVIRSFDATRNGLLGVAADVNDYPFLVDEKQVADDRLKDQFSNLIYALANGIGRTKMNKDSSLKDVPTWRTIAVMTGETPMLDDSAHGGAFTRLIQIRTPQQILSADACKQIRDIVKNNYGLILPRVIDKIFEIGTVQLRKKYSAIQKLFAKNHTDILEEHRRYISVVTLADWILNLVLGMDADKAAIDSANSISQVFDFIPTEKDVDDTERETAALYGFITKYQNNFIGTNQKTSVVDNIPKVFGKLEPAFYFITVDTMKDFCKENNLNYSKTVDDLIAADVIIPSDKIKAGHKTPLKTHVKKLGSNSTNCFQVRRPPDDYDYPNDNDDFEGEILTDDDVPFNVK